MYKQWNLLMKKADDYSNYCALRSQLFVWTGQKAISKSFRMKKMKIAVFLYLCIFNKHTQDAILHTHSFL
jgi:hypothetical protein